MAAPFSPPSLRGAAAASPPRAAHILSPQSALGLSLRGASAGRKPCSLSWTSSFPDLGISSSAPHLIRSPSPLFHLPREPQVGVVRAAWTRRSRGEAVKNPSRKSWKQRTDMYMRPFLLNVFFSNRFIHAKVMHRGTSKVISVASTNSKDLRNTLPSLTDNDACRTIGKLIAERSKEADVFAMAYELKKGERIEGKLGIVIDTIKENDWIERQHGGSPSWQDKWPRPSHVDGLGRILPSYKPICII